MRDVALRAMKDELLTPVAARWFTAVHPNVVSLVALGVGLAAAASVMIGQMWLGLVLWLANRLLDGLDGLVARVHGKQSDLGGYLDLLLDFVVYLAVPLAFVYAAPTTFNLWAGLILVSVYVLNVVSWTVLAAILEKTQVRMPGRMTSIEMPAGLIEGAETILFYALFFLLPGAVGWLFLVMAALVLFTVGQRVVWAARYLD